MSTPFIRAKANDCADNLDNVTAYLDASNREEIVDYVKSTLDEIGKVIAHAKESGQDPGDAYRAFVGKFNEYWNPQGD
jgi:hypothetical protein